MAALVSTSHPLHHMCWLHHTEAVYRNRVLIFFMLCFNFSGRSSTSLLLWVLSSLRYCNMLARQRLSQRKQGSSPNWLRRLALSWNARWTVLMGVWKEGHETNKCSMWTMYHIPSMIHRIQQQTYSDLVAERGSRWATVYHCTGRLLCIRAYSFSKLIRYLFVFSFLS